MSDEIGRMSEEDKFLGVRTTMELPSDTSASTQVDEIDVEVVDDRPDDDQRISGKVPSSDDDVATDEEISNYGSRAQKRIKKLKWL